MSERRLQHSADDADNWRRWELAELGAVASEQERRVRREQAPAPRQDNRNTEEQARLKARQQGYDEGYQEGYQLGLAEGQRDGLQQGLTEGREQAARELDEQLQALMSPMQKLVQSFEEALLALDDDIADRLTELALFTGRQLAREALDKTPETLVKLVRELLHAEPTLTERPRLRLHPDDLKIVDKQLGKELETAGWRMAADEQITRGGCQLISSSGELDATWESRWQAVSAPLRRRRSQRRPPENRPSANRPPAKKGAST